MIDKVNFCHEVLSSIYDKAEDVMNELKKLSFQVTLNSYNKHFIKINDEFVEQKYYMPVITVEDKGDICFNLDGEQFEFYVTKENLLNEINIQELIDTFKSDLYIYEFVDCTVDVYKYGDTKENILERVSKSEDTKFGVSLNCSNLSILDLVDKFNRMSFLLGI